MRQIDSQESVRNWKKCKLKQLSCITLSTSKIRVVYFCGYYDVLCFQWYNVDVGSIEAKELKQANDILTMPLSIILSFYHKWHTEPFQNANECQKDTTLSFFMSSKIYLIEFSFLVKSFFLENNAAYRVKFFSMTQKTTFVWNNEVTVLAKAVLSSN